MGVRNQVMRPMPHCKFNEGMMQGSLFLQPKLTIS